jgi:tRNA A-37 threonylcarbamoyl transferase component Bud32
MAEILLGRESGPHGFERPVVIKRILPHLARDPKFVEMFIDEARTVATIRHANVVQVHELVQHEGELALVMEFLEGESADALLRRLASASLRMPVALAAHVVAAACAGLHAAHELTGDDGSKRQLVHRDVTPHNLLITFDGQVKVIDFGIAKVAGGASRTETGHIKGKFAYMSPEQCSGEPLDRRSDVFSLGVVLFELATGHRAFKRATDLLTMRAICEDPVVKPSEIVAGFSAELEAVILRALARNREDRFATAADMRRELLAAMRTLPLDDDPEAALGALMRETFASQITEKRDMLRRVAQGQQLESPPASDPDEDDAAVPIALSGEPTRTATVWATGSRPAPRRRKAIAFGVVAAAMLAIGAVALRSFDDERPIRTNADLVPVVPASPVTSARTVKFAVRSEPRGARVELDDEELGVTPLTVELPATTAPRVLRVTRQGYEHYVERVQLSSDQHLELQLKPTSPAARVPPRLPSAASTQPPRDSSAKPPRDFHGFD